MPRKFLSIQKNIAYWFFLGEFCFPFFARISFDYKRLSRFTRAETFSLDNFWMQPYPFRVTYVDFNTH